MKDVLLPFSARNTLTLNNVMKSVVEDIIAHKKDPLSCALTLQTGRRAFEYRQYLIWSEGDDLQHLMEVEKKAENIQAEQAFTFTVRVQNDLDTLPRIDQELESEYSALGKIFSQEVRNAVAQFSANQRSKIIEATKQVSEDIAINKAASFVIQYAFLKTLQHFITPYQCVGEGIGVIAYQCAIENLDIQDGINQLDGIHKREESASFEIILGKCSNTQSDKALSLDVLNSESMLKLLGEIWRRGGDINWEKLYITRPIKVSLPQYQFEKTVLPHEIKPLDQIKLKGVKENLHDRILTETEVKRELKNIWREILGVEDIDDQDDFLNLGGDSLNIVHMGSVVTKKMGVLLPVDEVLSDARFDKTLALILSKQKEDKEREIVITPVSKREYYPTSYAQKRMYTAQEIAPDSTAYNLGACYLVEGKLDIKKLEHVFNTLIQTHDSLRTSFHLIDGKVVQKVHEVVDNPVETLWLEEGTQPDIEQLTTPFTLSLAPLMRVKILIVEENKSYLYIDMHHIIGDQSSIAILLNDIHRLYNDESIVKSHMRYIDYANWQNNMMQSNQYEKSLAFWRENLAHLPAPIERFGDFIRPKNLSSKGKYYSVNITADRSNKIKAFASKNGLTHYMVMVAAYALLIRHYTGEQDIVLGTAVAGRHLEPLQHILGMFVNTLPIRLYVDDDIQNIDYLNNVKKTILNVFKHQETPLDMLLEALNINQSTSHTPIFDICINYVNMGTEDLKIDNLNMTPLDRQSIDVKYDLTLTIVEKEDAFSLDIEYRTALFKESTIQQFLSHYQALIQAMTESTTQEVKKITFMTEGELASLQRLNDTRTEAPIDKSVITLFETVVESQPNHAALTWENVTLDYQTLNNMANWYASKLHNMNIVKGNRVALLLNQGIEQIIAILAVLKLGAQYMPIDPSYPKERIAFMLEDAACCLCITNESHLNKVTYCQGKVIALSEYTFDGSTKVTSPYTPSGLNGEDEMYVIYTSGSTGQPKGVVLQHKGVIRTVMNTNYYNINPQDCITQMINYTFDPSVMEIFGGLLNGAHIHMIPKALLLDFTQFEQYIKEVGITKIIFVTPIFHLLMDYNPKAIQGIQKIFIGGEALNPKHVKKAIEMLGPGNVINVYGPTEGTIVASYFKVNRIERDWVSVPIGKPISGTALYIVDQQLNQVPIGISGELIIAGSGVAKGYLNQEALNREKFVELPFANNAIGYRTHDLVVMDKDYNIHFKGRMDTQVKIDGYRIELDEIKHRILDIEGVAEAFVRDNCDLKGNKYLEAYYVLNESARQMTTQQLSHILVKLLPAYMVPARLKQLLEMPLTSNGKIDKNRLPKIEMTANHSEVDSLSDNVVKKNLNTGLQQDPKSRILAHMRNVLDVKNLSEYDDFFDNSGQSIKAIALSQALREEGFQITVNDIFARRTARALAENLIPNNKKEDEHDCGTVSLDEDFIDILVENYCIQAQNFSKSVAQAKNGDLFDLSPIQLLHSSLGNDGTGFASKFSATDDMTIKRRVIDLIANQDMLHCILSDDNKWQLKDLSLMRNVLIHALNIVDFSDYDEKTQVSLIEKLYSVLVDTQYNANDIPWRLLIAKLSSNQYIAIWCFDHLVFDGMSAEILSQSLEGNLHGDGNYRAYVNLLNKGPLIDQGTTICEKYNIDTWLIKNSQMMKDLKDKSVHSPMVLTIELPLDGSMSKTWRRGYDVVKDIFNLRETERAIPLLVVNFGRHYRGNTFFDVAGEFLDFVPFYYEGENIEAYLAKRSKNIQEDALNFIWLMQKGDKQERYRTLSNRLSSIRDEHVLNTIIMNFQGYITSEQQDLFKNVRSEEIIPISKVFVNVFYDDNTLTVMIYSEYGFTQQQIDLYPEAEINHLTIVEQEK